MVTVATGLDNTMIKENMASYILACGAGEGSASPKRISAIFCKYGALAWRVSRSRCVCVVLSLATNSLGDDDAGILSMSGFLQFYRDACEDRLDAVWTDLGKPPFRSVLLWSFFCFVFALTP